MKEMTVQQLANILENQPEAIFLLDIREPGEVDICTIAHSVHIPMNLIPLYLDQIPDGKPIIIYCHHGVRSLNVAQYLISAGFDEEQVFSLQGGINDWALQIDKTMNRY